MVVSPKLLPYAVLLCALLWGSAFPGIKAIYSSWEAAGIEPSFNKNMLIAGIRFTLSGSMLLIIAQKPIQDFKNLPKLPLISFALLQTTIQYVFFYSALAVSSSVLGGLLTSMGSFWWLLLAPILLKTAWPTKVQWSLFMFGAAGVIFAIYSPGAGSGNLLLGVPLFLGSTFSGALAIIVYQKMTPYAGPRSITGFGLFTGGILLILIGIPSWEFLPLMLNTKVIILTLYLAMVSAIGFGIWNYLSQLFPVNLLAGYRFLIPICAVTEATIFVKGEAPGMGIIIGGMMIIFSIISLNKLKEKAG